MKVTGCGSCPLFSEGCYCGHPEWPDQASHSVWDLQWSLRTDDDAPAECPLRIGNLLLELNLK